MPASSSRGPSHVRCHNVTTCSRHYHNHLWSDATTRCVNVKGEPTRNTLLDGDFGRSDTPVLIHQPRLRRPGWDGCRDRQDNRSDLPQDLQWDHPSQRAGHAAIYSEDYGLLMVYGGQGPVLETAWSVTRTAPTTILDDFWQYSIHNCVHNCSNHGTCSYGYCTCDDGWYAAFSMLLLLRR